MTILDLPKRLGHGLILGCLALGSLLHAQESATMVGTATDTSGAVVPNTKIVIINEATAADVRDTVTNTAGIYSAPNLPPGHYTLRAEASGFSKFERTGIVLDVASTVKEDVSLVVGSTTQSIAVQADQIQIQTETNELSSVVTGSQIDQIDTNGRNVINLTELVPGASSAMPRFQSALALNQNFNISFNGARYAHNDYLIDGGEIYNRGGGATMLVNPSQNAIAEFKVISGNAAGDEGMASSGGYVSMSIKGGTRNLHGQAWEYVRNDLFDANNYFAKQSGTPKPELRYNIFGFNAGGPVVIPSLYNENREKTFFFFNMEWRKLIQGNQIFATAIPSAAFGGNFGNLPVSVPQTSDPAAIAKFASVGLAPGDPFPNNQIPASLIDPNVALLLKAGIFPAANTPDGAHFSSAAPSATDVREEVARVDHRINSKLSLMSSFIYDGGTQSIPTTEWSGDTYPTVGTLLKVPSWAAVVHLTQAISPRLINETDINANGVTETLSPTGIFKQPPGYDAKTLYPEANADSRNPDISLGAPYGVSYYIGEYPYTTLWYSLEAKDDVSWVHGKHNFMFGGNFVRGYEDNLLQGETEGNYTFSGGFTGNSFADFLLGYSSNFNQLQAQNIQKAEERTLSFYGLDNWRATNKLTVNAGLRWQYIPHLFDLNNHIASFNPALYDTTKAPIFNPDGSLDTNGPGFSYAAGIPGAITDQPFYLNGVIIAGRNGTPRGIGKNYHNNFGPRVGFTYGLGNEGKMVLRGGFGMFYERMQGGDYTNGGGNPPFSNVPSTNNVYFSNAARSAITGLTAAVPSFPSSLTTIDPYYPIPTSMQYSLGVQRQLSSTAIATMTYAGNRTYHQSIARDINTVPLDDPNRLAICSGNCGYMGPAYNANLDRNYPGFASINQYQNGVTSSYNSLQVVLLIRNWHGLNLSGAYTWSHAIDYQSSDLYSQASNPYDLAYDKGNSDFDRRHIAQFSYYYELPFFRGSDNLLAKTMLSGWQLSGITTAETGSPMSATLGYDNTGLGGIETSRANVTGSVQYPKTAAHWFDGSSFSAPTPLTFGNSGRNSIYGPGLFNWNLALFKRFPLWREGTQFEFRAETFNTFNHTEFSGVNNNFSNGSQFGEVTSVNDPRTFQLGGSLTF
jgi:hypothetical protein